MFGPSFFCLVGVGFSIFRWNWPFLLAVEEIGHSFSEESVVLGLDPRSEGCSCILGKGWSSPLAVGVWPFLLEVGLPFLLGVGVGLSFFGLELVLSFLCGFWPFFRMRCGLGWSLAFARLSSVVVGHRFLPCLLAVSVPFFLFLFSSCTFKFFSFFHTNFLYSFLIFLCFSSFFCRPGTTRKLATL